MSIKRLIVIFSQLIIWAAVYGILVAHVPYLINLPWTTCDHCNSKLGCNLMLHLFDAPLTLFNLYAAWFGLKRFSESTQKLYISLLDSVFAVNLVFFSFECVFIYFNLQAGGPGWESIVLASLAVILLGASGIAFYIKQKLIESIN